MNAVEIRGVSKRFRKTSEMTTLKSTFIQRLFSKSWTKANSLDVLKDIDLNVKKGTTLGLIGKNGSGKSTLLRLLAGIYKPTAGNIIVNGRISALIELGAGFHPEFTGRENVFINGIILGLSKKKIRERFDEIVKFAGLEDFIDEPVRTYSSGMYMRLGFSVAVNVDPDILLIDEVLAVGDEAFAHKCKDKLDGFKQKGKTIIFVTHDLNTVENWCDEAIWLSDGIIKEFGTPKRVVDAYKEKVMEEEEKVLEAEHELMSKRLAAKKGLGNKNRWGSKEIEITSVKFLDVDNREKYIFNAGDFCVVEVKYKVNKEVDEPVFGIGISRPDGVHCYGTNTNIDKVDFKYNRQNGKVRFIFDSLDLLEGSYLFDVAVHAQEGNAYDYHSRLYSLSIRSNIKDQGVFRPRHSWDFV